MNNYLKRITFFSIPLILFFAGIATYNSFLDPFGVIRGDVNDIKIEPNQHILKMKYLLDNPGKFDSFLCGTSRVAKMDVSKIILPGDWYNLSYSEGLPSETLEDLKILVKNGIEVKSVIMGIDEITCFVSKEMHKNQSLRRPYESRIKTLFHYMFLKPSLFILKSILNAQKATFYSSGMYSVITGNGSFLPNLKDDFIESNIEEHRKDEVFETPYWQNYYENRASEALQSVAELKGYCDENKIKLIVFINPLYSKTYEKAVKNGFGDFLKKLNEISPYYDFSGVNQITSDPYYFYEASHFRPIVGDMMVDILIGAKPKIAGFGSYNIKK